jgi:hypothetical protein
MGKMTVIEKFILENSISKINAFLHIFATYHVKKLPDFLIDDEEERVMLDILKVREEDIIIPVVIRSTSWLRLINSSNERVLKICLHDEIWPFQQRFELIHGTGGVSSPELALARYLKTSFDFWCAWGKNTKKSLICVSERVADFATSEDLKSLIKKVQVIELSEEYKAQEVDIF